jgi:hypothetical protein
VSDGSLERFADAISRERKQDWQAAVKLLGGSPPPVSCKGSTLVGSFLETNSSNTTPQRLVIYSGQYRDRVDDRVAPVEKYELGSVPSKEFQ